MSMQFFPPDVLAKTTRIAKRNNLSLEVLIARNDYLSLLICLRNELVSWKQDRRALYKEFRNLVQIRNRIAHHEIVYNYPLVETVDFAKQLLVDINPVASEELEGRNYAALIDKIRLGSGGGI
jgi:hypothetical protein